MLPKHEDPSELQGIEQQKQKVQSHEAWVIQQRRGGELTIKEGDPAGENVEYHTTGQGGRVPNQSQLSQESQETRQWRQH